MQGVSMLFRLLIRRHQHFDLKPVADLKNIYKVLSLAGSNADEKIMVVASDFGARRLAGGK